MLRVDGVITHDTVYTLVLRLDAGSGASERRFDAPSCAELLEPAAVVVAVAVDPLVEPPPRVPELPEDPQPRAAPPHEEAAPRAVDLPREIPVPQRPRRSRWPLRSALGIFGGVDGGNLPAAGGLLAGSLGLLVGRARAELVVLHVFARTIDDDERGAGSFRITAARGQGCFEPRARRLSFPLCAGLELGAIRGIGVDVPKTDRVRRLWLALVGSAGLAWAPIPRLALVVRGELVVGPRRHAFTLGGRALVTTGAVGARGLAGLELRLP